MIGNVGMLDDLECMKGILEGSLLRAFEGLGKVMAERSSQSVWGSPRRNGEYTAPTSEG